MKYYIFESPRGHLLIRELMDNKYHMIYNNHNSQRLTITVEQAKAWTRRYPKTHKFTNNIDKYMAKAL